MRNAWLRKSFRARFAHFAIAAAVCGALAAAPLASATTSPSKTLLIEVLVSPKGVVVGKWASTQTHDGLLTVGGPIPRGDFLNFMIVNRGKSALSFTAFGRKLTRPVPPGKHGHFNVLAKRRGKFKYTAQFVGGKTYNGVFLVQ